MDKKMGLGLELISDKRGINKKMGGNLFYSYRINLNENAHLSMGLSLGIFDQSLDYSQAIVENTADATLFSGSEHKTTCNVNAGLAFVWKGLEAGAAIPQAVGNRISFNNTNVQAYYTQVPHYMGSLKYKFFISRDKGITIAPQALIRFVPNTPLQYDGHIHFDWNKRFWLGAAYKSNYAVAVNAGLSIHKQLSIGYSYDIITGAIGTYSGMSHEIMVAFQFGQNKKIRTKPVAQDSSQAEPEKEEPVQEVKEVPKEIPGVENKQPNARSYEKNRDSLETKLDENIQKENKDALKSKPQPLPVAPTRTISTLPVAVTGKKDFAPAENKSAAIVNNGIWMATNSALDFKDVDDRNPQKGFYVVVGSFHNRDFAQEEVLRLVNEGYKTTGWIYFEPTRFNYVYTIRSESKKEAFKQANRVKATGINDVWIQRITE
jgi:type IX secretion system PorP/SprF family membrane protein